MPDTWLRRLSEITGVEAASLFDFWPPVMPLSVSFATDVAESIRTSIIPGEKTVTASVVYKVR